MHRSNVLDHQLPLRLPGYREGKSGTRPRRKMRWRWLIRNQTQGVLSREDAAARIRKALPTGRYARTLIPSQADVAIYAISGDFDWQWFSQALQLVVWLNPCDPSHLENLVAVLDAALVDVVSSE